MKKVLYSFLACLMIMGFAAVTAQADDIEDLKAQVQILQEKIAEIEANQAAAPAAAPATGLPSNLSFSGYFRGRLHNSTVDSEASTFEATEVAFQPRWDATDRIHGEMHLWTWPSQAGGFLYTESAMLIFDDYAFETGSKLILGKTRNHCYGITPSGGGRLLSNYSLYSDAIHHDRVFGVQMLNKLDNGRIDLNLAIINGYQVGTRTVGIALLSNQTYNGTDSTYVLANRESGFDDSSGRAMSLRLGGNVTPRLNMGISGYYSKISDTDLVTLNALAAGGAGSTNQTQRQIGLDFRFKEAGWIWQVEYTNSSLSYIDFDAFQTVVGYTFTEKNSAYVQYGLLNYDLPGALLAANTQLIDKQQLALSFKHKLTKKAWLTLEHEFNLEDNQRGANSVVTDGNNNMTFLEWMIVY